MEIQTTAKKYSNESKEYSENLSKDLLVANWVYANSFRYY